MLNISTLGRVFHSQCKLAWFYSASNFKVTYQLSGRWVTFIQSSHSQEQPRRISTRAVLRSMRGEVQILLIYLLYRKIVTQNHWQLECIGLLYWMRVVGKKRNNFSNKLQQTIHWKRHQSQLLYQRMQQRSLFEDGQGNFKFTTVVAGQWQKQLKNPNHAYRSNSTAQQQFTKNMHQNMQEARNKSMKKSDFAIFFIDQHS